jgi:type III secretion system YscQ/HrcQ family protein
MVSATDHKIKKLIDAQVDIFNGIFQYERELFLNAGNDDYSVNFTLTNNISKSILKFGILINDKLYYELTIDKIFISRLIIGNDFIEKLDQTPRIFRNIAIEVALEKLLDRFEKYCQCSSKFVELADNQLNINDIISLNFRISREADESEFFGTIVTNHEGATWLLKKYGQLPLQTANKFRQIPLNVKFERGYSTLKFREVSNIEINDIILMDEDKTFEKSLINVCIDPETKIIGRIESAKKITLKEKIHKKLDLQMDSKKDSDTMLSQKQIGEIPVHLVFQVGETQLKFSEVVHLQPGYTFELENEINHQVEIKANGKTIGRGELVEIGDRLGVRVIQFYQDKI